MNSRQRKLYFNIAAKRDEKCPENAVPKSSTTIALISMIHDWTIATDGNGSTVRSILYDFRKAFDLIDHSILCNKLCDLDLPTSVINWIIDFLSNRFQRTKLADGCYSEWGSVPSGVPQGTKLGPWLFVLMINDLVLSGICLWKYVDDTTASEVIKKGESSAAQRIADGVSVWSEKNKLQLNSAKCKELRISFAKKKQVFQPVEIDGKVLDVVNSAKLLGITITSDLTWNEHINGVIKKAAKRLFFLVQLKRAKVPLDDLKLFYITCIRSTLDYAVPVFHFSLPKYLIHELELIQKRALAIMYPSFNYNEALIHLDLVSLHEHHRSLCKVFFNNIVNDKNHRLHHLLPPVRRNERYTFRHKRTFAIPKVKTERVKRSFIIASSLNVDN